jgi:hypothetical protein
MLKARQILLPVALFFTLLPFAGYQSGREQWAMLSDFPAGAIASAVVALAMWLAYATARRGQRA